MELHADDVPVIMVPLPAQGHLNPMLHLARMVTTKGLQVHFIGSATHNRQAKDRVQGWDPCTVSNIHFHDFQVPQVVTPPLDSHASDKFPNHLIPTIEASYQLRQPLGVLLRELSSRNRRCVVVHDAGMSFAAEEASSVSNAEVYCLNTYSAFALLYLEWEAYGAKPIDQGGDIIPADLPRVLYDGSNPEMLLKWAAQKDEWTKFVAGEIYNTCDAIECRFIDLLAQLRPNRRHLAIGPFNPISVIQDSTHRHECLEWLDKQPVNSVIYVSFGTSTSLTDEQITELAVGLERSQQRFLWVLRDADRGEIYKEEDSRKVQLPRNGFEERTEGLGIIVRNWAPQLHILAHPSTGGFMSHCGWNSCVESLSMGVPIAAWAMHSDQPRNAELVTEVLKAGLVVRDWADREKITSAHVIESSLRKLMVSKEGNMLRNKANELGLAIRRSVSDGGSTMIQLETFIAHISR